MAITKRVEYAYPTSTVASRFGRSKAGCYIIEIDCGVRPDGFIDKQTDGPFSTPEEAHEAAKQFFAGIEWCPLYRRFHPDHFPSARKMVAAS